MHSPGQAEFLNRSGTNVVRGIAVDPQTGGYRVPAHSGLYDVLSGAILWLSA